MTPKELHEKALELIRSYKVDGAYGADITGLLLEAASMASDSDGFRVGLAAAYKFEIEGKRP